MTNPTKPSHSLILYSAAAATALAITWSLVTKQPTQPRRIIPSPRTTLLPRLTPSQIATLGYPPDALPGARDVNTPYGSMRVYEWGSATGKKVVLVHGDATPAPIFSRIANELVTAGCRVICLDLWGRGYSDTPSGLQHNSELYTKQIQYALSSSTAEGDPNGQISLVGFSMGCSIVLDFFGSHAFMIEDIVLLGPGGLLRDLPAEYKSFWFNCPGLVSAAMIRRLIGKTLGVDLQAKLIDIEKEEETTTAEVTETGFSPARAVQFQFDYHQGHIESFLSNIRYGPIQHQEATWQKAGDLIVPKSNLPLQSTATKSVARMHGRKILVICGDDDDIVPPSDVKEDLDRYFTGQDGAQFFEFKTVPGNHGFPWPEGTRIGKMIADFWEL